MAKEICCPNCGNRELQVQTETDVKTSGKDFSGSQACCGAFLFGPLGVLCGSCGQKKTVSTTNTTSWNCPKCGRKFVAPDDMRKQIDNLEKSYKVVTAIWIFEAICLTILAAIFIYIFTLKLAPTIIGSVLLGAISFAIFEGISYYMTKYKAKMKTEELEQLEKDMARFLQQ